MKRISLLCLAILIPLSVSYSQDALELQPDRNIPPSKQYSKKNPSNDPQVEPKEETPSERNTRIKNRFGDSELAVVLIEDAEKNRGQLQVEEIREKLSEASDKLATVRSNGVSAKKRKQLADAWGRLAKSERFLFGDTDKNLEWLRNAYDLDPDNEDVARALDVAERKQSYAFAQLEEAARVRAQRGQQN